MVCAQKGYPLVITMSESFSVERRKLMRFLGAKVVLTPAAEMGLGMVNKAAELARERPETRIVVCEPEISALLSSGVGQERHADGSPAVGHPVFTPHPMQGWTPDFIPKLTGDAVDMDVIDRILKIAAPDALKCSRNLARQEGIFVGITSGATFAGALQICEQAEKGATILCMLPDTGERYLSTSLFGDVEADMNEPEQEIAHSTPNYRLAPTA
jgi:cysteine synthase